jgi:hypothetical protein
MGKLQVRPVRLEFLRAGPPHNQLLSPLTPYLAICGDSPAGVVHVPYEHAVFERRLADLRYTGLSELRLAQLRDTGADMARMLAEVPGLPGSIISESDAAMSMIHLRITLSVSELALLPFELSKVPIAVEGESEAWLALQTKPPVCITRRIRTVSAEGITWPSSACILFIAGPLGDIPFEGHRRALEAAIEPYRYPERHDPVEGINSRHTHYGDLLTIIENASLDDVVTAVKKTSYTHVHVLAHGAVDFSSKGRPFGIRLRGRNGGTDIVSGERFSTALARVSNTEVHRPFVVTMASCDAGLVANVVEPAPGASFVHALHQSGIPLVVGSQFPLTKEASVTVVEVFYGGLLRGDNPHVLAHQTRSELHSRYGADTHDWASLVVYEALPTDMDAQLERITYMQAKQRLDAALQRVDVVVRDAVLDKGRPVDLEDLELDVRNAIGALPTHGPYVIESRGLRATALKRLAQAMFIYGRASDAPELHFGRSCDHLEEALGMYKAASDMFLRNEAVSVQRVATLHWVLVQQIVLQAVLRYEISADIWATASHAATLYLDDTDAEERAWAHSSLAELALLRLAMPHTGGDNKVGGEVRHHLGRLIESLPSEKRFPISSTAKEFQRYVEWWGREPFAQFATDRVQAPRKAQNWRDAEQLVEVARDAFVLLSGNMSLAETTSRRRAHPPSQKTSGQPSEVPAPGTLSATSTRRPRSRRLENVFMNVHMLPAQYGDCLWIDYGSDPRKSSHVLIDCGPPGTCSRLLAKIEALPSEDKEVELFILSHIDDDHIGGAIPFLEAELGGLRVQEVWFNGYKHLSPLLNAKEGERFSALIERHAIPWNVRANGEAIAVKDTLPEHTLPGGLKLTLLSPTDEKLKALGVRWEREMEATGQVAGSGLVGDELLGGEDFSTSTDVEAMATSSFRPDTAVPNGSSIAVLAEFEGKSVLLAADAHPPVLEESIKRLLESRRLDRLPVDALKVSHHGSHGNTSPALLELVDCRKYLISTNGQKFHHPHRPTISRLVTLGGPRVELLFNYAGKDNDVWARPDLQERYRYSTTYPETTEGLVVRL